MGARSWKETTNYVTLRTPTFGSLMLRSDISELNEPARWQLRMAAARSSERTSNE